MQETQSKSIFRDEFLWVISTCHIHRQCPTFKFKKPSKKPYYEFLVGKKHEAKSPNNIFFSQICKPLFP